MLGTSRIKVDVTRRVLVRVLLEKLITDLTVRTAIEGYLQETGVLPRVGVSGWFYWIDASKTTFAARCADPPLHQDDSEDHGWKPWNYFVVAEVESERTAVALVVAHDSDPALRKLGRRGD